MTNEIITSFIGLEEVVCHVAEDVNIWVSFNILFSQQNITEKSIVYHS